MGILGALGGAMTGGMGSVAGRAAGAVAGRGGGAKPAGPKGAGTPGGIADLLRKQPQQSTQPVPIPGATGMPPPPLATKAPSDMQAQGRTAPEINQPMGGLAARILGRRGSSF